MNAASGVGNVLSGGLGIAGGVFGAIQAGRVKEQQMEILKKQKQLFYGFQLPTMQKKNYMTFGKFKSQMASSGSWAEGFASQSSYAQEAQDLSNTLNLKKQQKEIEFQAQENQINNQYSSNLFQGISQSISGAVNVGSGIAELAV